MNISKPPDIDKISTSIDGMRSWPNVMYGDIYNYLISSKAVDGQEMKRFKSLQSDNYFQSGNVSQIPHCSYEDNDIMLKAAVRSSQIATRANEVYCEQDGTVVKGSCSYMAGQGHSYSHIGSLMWKLEHAVGNSLTRIACTDEIAKWNIGKKRNV